LKRKNIGATGETLWGRKHFRGKSGPTGSVKGKGRAAHLVGGAPQGPKGREGKGKTSRDKAVPWGKKEYDVLARRKQRKKKKGANRPASNA